ncbi:MAG: Fic family protein [Nanoarchaeota archaeon]|nr:Fic family protein [Nanoarchaeota archaeon]
MAWIFKKKPKLNEKTIIDLHKIIVENTGVTLGYKTLPNFLLGRNVKTAPPEKVKLEMKNLLKWYKESKNLHPLEKAAVFHGKFEKIHPFEDGNGRVGRLLINIILLNYGYPPLIIRKTQRIAYFHALEAFDNKHFDNLYHFLIEKYQKTYDNFFKIYIKYI